MEQGTPQYDLPRLVDYGRLQDVTANNGQPVFVDVPQGTPVPPPSGDIVGDDDNLS